MRSLSLQLTAPGADESIVAALLFLASERGRASERAKINSLGQMTNCCCRRERRRKKEKERKGQ